MMVYWRQKASKEVHFLDRLVLQQEQFILGFGQFMGTWDSVGAPNSVSLTFQDDAD